jgi:subtilisin family serine protease
MVATTWNAQMVRAREAQAMLPRRPDDPNEIDWGEIEIAQINTGCTRHSVFGPWQGDKSPTLAVEDGLNLIEKGKPPFDPLDYEGTRAHGTRILSVLCGRLPGTFFGIAPGVPTIPYRAVNQVVIAKKTARKRIATAIRHAVDVNACEVISMSLGFPVLSLFAQRHMGMAVDHAYENGVIVVAAGGQIVDRVTYPGKFSRTIGVGGVREDRHVWFPYEKGMARRSIDVWAPADDIPRANSKLEDGVVKEDVYGDGDGTSYATAHVAAAAAMWLVHHRDSLDQAYTKPWQWIEAFRKLLAETRQKIEGDYWPDKSKGILDIEALLKADLPKAADLRHERRKAADEKF